MNITWQRRDSDGQTLPLQKRFTGNKLVRVFKYGNVSLLVFVIVERKLPTAQGLSKLKYELKLTLRTAQRISKVNISQITYNRSS